MYCRYAKWRVHGHALRGYVELDKMNKRFLLLLIVGVGVVLVAGYLLLPALNLRAYGSPERGQGKIVNIQIAMDGFDLKEIHIAVGQKLTVNLSSLDNEHHADGGGKHQFAIPELGINIIAGPLSSASATFTPTRPGTYLYYCDICCGGKSNPTMTGKLVVDPAGPY